MSTSSHSTQSWVSYEGVIPLFWEADFSEVDLVAMFRHNASFDAEVFNTLRPRQNGRHFPDDIFTWIFLNENVWIAIKISLKFVPWG